MENQTCKDHSAHVARIESLEVRQNKHEDDSNKVRARLFDAIDDLKKNYLGEAMKRLPVWVTIFISILCSLVSGLIMYSIKIHNEKPTVAYRTIEVENNIQQARR